MKKTTNTIKANIKVHDALLESGEYEKSPHRLTENKNRVKTILETIKVEDDILLHLDCGCGDGFIFECVPDKWKSYGVDASEKMINKCKSNHENVNLKVAPAESLPFDDNSFNVVTCYSFLDHLENREIFYKEVKRVLKKNGVFYFGLSPNKFFAEAIKLKDYLNIDGIYSQETLDLEHKKTLSNDEYYLSKYGLKKSDIALAEPGKTKGGGMDVFKEIEFLKKLNFKSLVVNFNWIMAQNKLSKNTVYEIKNAMPVTMSAFKYFDIFGIKV